MKRLLDQRGFNLTNLLVIAGIVIAAITAWRFYGAYRDRAAAAKAAQAQMTELRERFTAILKLDDSWRATLASLENRADVACLRSRTSCTQKGGPLAVRDHLNRLAYDSHPPVNGFAADGSLCAAFTEAGYEGCPIRLDITWEPACSGDCVDPHSVMITGKLRFRGGAEGRFAGIKLPDQEFSVTRSVSPATPRTCYEAMQAGRDHDGVYRLRPDPAGQTVNVYCDQTRDGGGWALLMAAASNAYTAFPESTPITPGFTGRLPSAVIRAYLDASAFQGSNNLKLEMPDVDGGLLLSASTAGAIEPYAYTAHVPSGDCRKVAEARNEATHHEAEGFGLFFSGAGEVGLDETSAFPEGYHGFTACFGTNGDRNCGMGCNRKWTGRVYRQRALVWMR